jgi:hypothetical protein
MRSKRIRMMAQVIGFACIGLLAFYGTAVAVSGRPAPWSAPSSATAAITPGYISYQGFLRDKDDEPANGTYTMTVRICDDEACSGGAAWCGTYHDVQVRDGRFSLLLGEDDGACGGTSPPPHGPIDPEIFVDPDRWVELKVGDRIMTPRQRLVAVPYAMAATYATNLSASDGDPPAAAKVDAEGNIKIRESGVCIDSDGYCDAPAPGGLGVGDGGIHGMNSSDHNLYLVPDEGKVGIGTKNPSERLTVAGSGVFTSTDGNVTIKAGDVEIPSGGLCIDSDGGCTAAQDGGIRVGDGGIHGTDTSGDDVYLVPDQGLVGIGTRDPQRKLDVRGWASIDGRLGVGDSTRPDHALDVIGSINWTGNLEGLTRSNGYVADSNGEGSVSIQMVEFSQSICFLVETQFEDIDGGEEKAQCRIYKSGDYWRLEADSTDGDDNRAYCKARCLSW